MGWAPDRDAPRGRVAVVAGATRGAGRGAAPAESESPRGGFAAEYGFTDVDGSQPGIWPLIASGPR